MSLEIKVIFVCHGNMRRSPMAQAIFQKLVDDNSLQDKLFCDSAGTVCNHLGIPPHFKTLEIIEKYEMKLDHKSRLFKVNGSINKFFNMVRSKHNL